MEGEGETVNALEDLLSNNLAAVALVPDDDPMVENEALHNSEEGVERMRNRASARTIFHQPRSDNDTVNSTRTLYDSDIEYLTIYGRRYCGEYYKPNDEEEQDREGMLHEIFKKIFNNRLTSVPLHNPTKILDIGTGTGEWAMDMGDEFPNAEVIGTDIAKIQPDAAPSNVFFQIDDAEDEEWTWEDDFDLVHLRSMQGAFMDWQRIYREAFRVLKKGGWIEVLDFDNHTRLMSYFSDGPDAAAWLAAVNEASRRSGRPRGDAHLDPEVLRKIGFVNVSVSERTIPTGAWPESPEDQNTGKWFLVTMLNGIEATSLRPLTEHMGWEIEDVRKSVRFVESRMKAIAMDKHKSKGMGFIIKTLVGMKPSDEGIPEVDVPDEESVKTMKNLNGDISSGK